MKASGGIGIETSIAGDIEIKSELTVGLCGTAEGNQNKRSNESHFESLVLVHEKVSLGSLGINPQRQIEQRHCPSSAIAIEKQESPHCLSKKSKIEGRHG